MRLTLSVCLLLVAGSASAQKGLSPEDVAGMRQINNVRISPDGQWVAFQSSRSGKWQVYRMRIDGTDLLPLTSNGENKGPDWSKKPE